MNRVLNQSQEKSLLDDEKTLKRLELNHRKNKQQDHTQLLDAAALEFNFGQDRDSYWNPERFSLLWGTPLWDQASQTQRVLLNQLYWVAYYSQIISAEIATIFFNQAAAASLYGLEDFRVVCDTLDLESSQERAHINAFKKVSEDFEAEVFGERIFSYAMRGPYTETMIHADTSPVRRLWKGTQLRAYTMLASSNPFIGCQYFTVRGVRTLNGKIVQHQLSQYYSKAPAQDSMPGPSKISFYHFMDESYHFNSSMLISKEVMKSLPAPKPLESAIANMALLGCQRDHYHFSTAINGIFWYDPSLFSAVEKLLRSPAFGFDAAGAQQMLERCFGEENEGMHASYATHRTALDSYKHYLSDMSYVWKKNREMEVMAASTLSGHVLENRRVLRARKLEAAA